MEMAVIRKMWADLMTPDDFRRNWYGGTTNQMGHTLAGIIGGILYLSIWREATGEMPYRWQAGVVLFAPYSVVIELMIQGWKGRDTLADIWFYMIGVMGALVPFQEVEVTGCCTLVVFNHATMLICVGAFLVTLFCYAYVRARRELASL